MLEKVLQMIVFAQLLIAHSFYIKFLQFKKQLKKSAFGLDNNLEWIFFF